MKSTNYPLAIKNPAGNYVSEYYVSEYYVSEYYVSQCHVRQCHTCQYSAVIPYLLITHVYYMVIRAFTSRPRNGGMGIIHISGADKFYVVLALLIIKTI